MKRLMLLLGAGAGAAATFFWLRGGADLGQIKAKAKHAMSDAENELDNLYPTDAGYAPSRPVGAS